jgi:hypothetical protein
VITGGNRQMAALTSEKRKKQYVAANRGSKPKKNGKDIAPVKN